jgi:hypothetical protein
VSWPGPLRHENELPARTAWVPMSQNLPSAQCPGRRFSHIDGVMGEPAGSPVLVAGRPRNELYAALWIVCRAKTLSRV